MSPLFAVRPANPDDAQGMAKVHVDTWRETYRGLMSDATLDNPDFLSWREHFWTTALTDPQRVGNLAAVATHEDSIVGIAMASQSREGESQHLFILYTYAAFHGSGAGSALLDAVLDPQNSATLWVADPNPRAQAFYRKHGFVPSGDVKVEDGVREIEMGRAPGKSIGRTRDDR